MAQTTGLNLPVEQSPFVDPSTGILSYDGKQYLLSILTEAETSQATATVATALTAKGTNQATALLLTSQWNEVDSAPNNSGVLLASYQPGQSQIVFNNSGLPILVYPPPGSQINALGGNEPYSLSTGTRATFDFFSADQIWT